jgi:hypothetical protein
VRIVDAISLGVQVTDGAVAAAVRDAAADNEAAQLERVVEETFPEEG